MCQSGQKYARLPRIDLRGWPKAEVTPDVSRFLMKPSASCSSSSSNSVPLSFQLAELDESRDSAVKGEGKGLGKIVAKNHRLLVISCQCERQREERQSRVRWCFPRSGRARGTRPRSVLPIRSVSTVNGQKFCHDSASPPDPHPVPVAPSPSSAGDPEGSRGIPDAVPEIPEWRRHLPKRGDDAET